MSGHSPETFLSDSIFSLPCLLPLFSFILFKGILLYFKQQSRTGDLRDPDLTPSDIYGARGTTGTHRKI